MKILNDNWLIFDNEMSLSKALAREILDIAKKSIFEKDCFSMVLTGGQSVLSLYKLLSKADSNWDKWHLYIGDERFLPAGHKDRNDQIINEIWLDNSPIPKKNIHFIKAELGLLEARLEYENTLKKNDTFDIVLLSMGEDGHVASLFPNHAYPENQMVVVEKNSPKPPKQRLSMSYKQLNKSNYIFKLLIGKSKQQAVHLIQNNINLPITKVTGGYNKMYVCKNAIY
ncbi:6-phosphogluconolactonase [Candidatus Woesearchaeota archaeon]|nr:6-phosphogluconolactonase [Candidatus Woesearchaeota archaeon]